MVDNNYTEPFNACILKARHVPIIKMLEEIRIKVMNLLATNGDDIIKWNDLRKKRCTCRVWQLSGITCPHAIKDILYDKDEPLSQIHWYYSKEAYSLTYNHKLQPVRGKFFWKVEPAHAMKSPDISKNVGRLRAKRTRESKEEGREWNYSRKRVMMTCNNCGGENHNAMGCFKEKTIAETSKSRKKKQ
ncbi:uncharacterized protein LOC142162359 [Nicotiana tabacum]|uniref:Uncharacterized protein LOC142162359 n=1 Tax=Nicotiana tabacum TaxID=4097 RepID=A0AC58RQ08_TOBAC